MGLTICFRSPWCRINCSGFLKRKVLRESDMIKSRHSLSLAFALITICASVPTMAQNISQTMLVSGNDLYGRCTSDPRDSEYVANLGFCRGYIYAAADFFATIAAEADRSSCHKAGVSNRQIVDLVIKYLRENPEKRNMPANYAVIEVMPALMSPCPG